MAEVSDNRRIAKNSMMLYIRMFIVMIIGFYTSRVVLQALGQEDYGLYGVVGSFVALFASLNSAMYGATSRFLTYSLGKKDKQQLKTTFDSAIVVHFWMAVLVFVLAESIGLWYVNNRLVMPPDRVLAANVVYQTTIIALLLNIMQVPYVASIIAHERMGIYAYVDVINVVLKLIIVFIMNALPYDKLISYACLMLLVSATVFLIYKGYTSKHFEECRFGRTHSRQTCKEIASFFGFNMFGNFGNIFNPQAINILINRFFGLVYNAANGIATTVSGMVNAFTGNMMTAFIPPITKSVAEEDMAKTEGLIALGMKMSLFFYALFAIPIIAETETIMSVWLVEVPPKSEIFTRLIVGGIMFEVIRRIVCAGIYAKGKIKFVSICIGLLQIINPFVVWFIFRHNPKPELAYLSSVVVHAILAVIIIGVSRNYLKGFRAALIAAATLKMIAIIVAVLVAAWYLKEQLPQTLWRVIVTGVVSTIMLSLLTYSVVLNSANRATVKGFIVGRIIKRRRI